MAKGERYKKNKTLKSAKIPNKKNQRGGVRELLERARSFFSRRPTTREARYFFSRSASTVSNPLTAAEAIAEEDRPQSDYPVRFEVFYDLLKQPLSGIEEIVILTKGTQQVLILGEMHQYSFCRKKGYTPLIQLIEPYLYKVKNVDLMVEMDNESVHAFDPNDEIVLDRVREIAAADENENFSEVNSEPLYLINLFRLLVQRFIPPQKLSPRQYAVDRSIQNRVSWLEPQTVFHSAAMTLGDEFVRQCDNFNKSYDSKNEESIILTRQKLHALIKEFCSKETVELFTWFELCDPPFTFEDIQKNSDTINRQFKLASQRSKRLFVTECLRLLMTSKFYRKCKEGSEEAVNQRGLPIQLYVDVFFQRSFEWISLDAFYFYLQRYFVDIFTVCRLLKHHVDPSMFKDVVIYEGSAHLIYQRSILELLGYEVHPIRMPFNSFCNENASYGGKRRRKKKTRELLRKRSITRQRSTGQRCRDGTSSKKCPP